MCTDDPILLRNTHNDRTIICIQRKASKKLVTEEDIIQANKLGFNDDIGTVTNYITSMFDVKSRFRPGSQEYKDLEYRIMCGQNYQQASIDRIKGIIAEPMPYYWYDARRINRDYDKPDKEYQLRIAANRKPSFLRFVYPALRRSYKNYHDGTGDKLDMLYGTDTGSIPLEDEDKIDCYSPISDNDCTVNRICRQIEKEFCSDRIKQKSSFDYSILKTGVGYSNVDYKNIGNQCSKYIDAVQGCYQKYRTSDISHDDVLSSIDTLTEYFKFTCEKLCPNEDELCDILVDILYKNQKYAMLVWAISGSVIIRNLLEKHGGRIAFPVVCGKDVSEFEYAGHWMRMESVEITEVEV